MCDCHQRLRLPQMSPEMNFVMKLQIAVVGLRRRHLYGCNRRSVLMQPCRWQVLAVAVAASSFNSKLRVRERSLPKNARRGLLN